MSRITYRPDIDGIRGVAVLFVVLYHADITFISGGFIGVDVFFVISGYLITSIILKDCKDNQFKILNFWKRRIRRILPALLSMMLFCLIVGYFLYLPEDFKNLGQQVFSQTFFASNILFYLQSGYFDSANETKPLLHTWSLAVEEQFYFFFPVALYIAWKFFRKYVVHIIVLVFILSFVFSIYGVAHHPSATFYMLPTRAWELLIGSLIVFLPSIPISSLIFRFFLGFAGVCALLLPAFLYTSETAFPGLAALPVCVGTAILIWLHKNNETPIKKILAWKPFVFIGLISYSWYLWHWPSIVFTKYYFYEGAPQTILIIAILISFIMAIFSWKFIEQPFRNTETVLFKKPVILLYSLVFMGILGMLSFLTDIHKNSISPSVLKYAAGVNDINPRRDECHYSNIEKLLENGPCFINKQKTLPITFLSFGDSFSTTLQPVLENLSQKYNISGQQASYSSCPPVFGINRKAHAKSLEQYQCMEFNNAVLDFIKKNKVKHVILFARWSAYMHEYPVFTKDSVVKDSRILFKEKLIKTIDILNKLGIKVWIIKQPPEHQLDVPLSLARALRMNKNINDLQINFSNYLERQKEISEIFSLIEKDMSGSKNVSFIDPAKMLCANKNTCIIEHDGYSLYRDKYHLSQYGVAFISPLFEEMFQEFAKIKMKKNAPK